MAKKREPKHKVTVKLDQERWLGYTWGDIDDLNGILKCDLLGDEGMLLKATQQNPRHLNFLLLYGLQHWDPRLKYETVREMVEDYLDEGGGMAEIIESIHEAMRAGGFLREKAGESTQNKVGPVGPGDAAKGGVGPNDAASGSAVPADRPSHLTPVE